MRAGPRLASRPVSPEEWLKPSLTRGGVRRIVVAGVSKRRPACAQVDVVGVEHVERVGKGEPRPVELRPLGRTGISVSAVGFGCGSIGGLFVRGTRRGQRRAVEAALEGGINYFDTAAQYGDGASEENLGRVLRELGPPVQAGILVGTKFQLARADLPRVGAVVRSKMEQGLRRLQLERVDVVTLHTRLGPEPDALCAQEVTGPVAEAMHQLVEAGLASAIGFTGLGRTEDILDVARCAHFDSWQCLFNLLNPSAAQPGSPDGLAQDFRGALAAAAAAGLGTFCVRVLAGGALGGRDQRHEYARTPGSAMAEGEPYGNDLRRAQVLLSRLDDFPVGSLPELAGRYALSEPRFSSVLVGFSDESDVHEALAWEASGALPPASLRTLRQIGAA